MFLWTVGIQAGVCEPHEAQDLAGSLERDVQPGSRLKGCGLASEIEMAPFKSHWPLGLHQNHPPRDSCTSLPYLRDRPATLVLAVDPEMNDPNLAAVPLCCGPRSASLEQGCRGRRIHLSPLGRLANLSRTADSKMVLNLGPCPIRLGIKSSAGQLRTSCEMWLCMVLEWTWWNQSHINS